MSDLGPGTIALLAPLILIEVGLLVWALWDLSRPTRRVRGGSKIIWALVILLVNFLGPIIYFLVAREEAPPPEDDAVASMPARAPALPAAPDAMPGWAAPPATGVVTTTPAASPAAGTSLAPPEERPVPVQERVGTAASGEPVVVCRGLTKRYGDGGVLAVDRLDLDVPAGSVFGLLGPNGAGKTTTLRMLVGLSHATAGTATVAGVPIGADDPVLTRRIGFLDQDPRYYDWATGDETVMLVGLLHGMSGAALEQRTHEVMAQVGLTEAAGRRVGTYSGGMRQRLGIAQALVARPPLLILDEPVSALDPEGRRDLLALISGLRGETTILFSTHVLSDVERICDRVGILDHGRLVTEGPLDALLERYALPIYRLDPERGQEAAIARLVARLGTFPWTTAIDSSHGVIRVAVTDPGTAGRELLPAVVAEGVSLVAYERARPTLEDVFLQLVGRENGPPDATGAVGATRVAAATGRTADTTAGETTGGSEVAR
jgi:ABC-2 type transport system ATP-binding protein